MMSPSTSTRFLLNDQEICTSAPPGLLVLDWLRKHRSLTGTKEGCKEGDCGACVVLVGALSPAGLGYRPVTACLIPLGELAGKHLVTIEGLNLADGRLTALQQAVVDEGGTQCGYCTPGIIVSMTHCLLEHRDAADLPAMKDALSGHLCRCTGYASLKRAAVRVRGACTAAASLEEALPDLVASRLLPPYFADLPTRLRALGAPSPGPPPPHARRIAGGTDLYVQQGEDLPDATVHLLNLYPDMEGVSLRRSEFHPDPDRHAPAPGHESPGHRAGDRLQIGALTTFEAFSRIPDIRARIPRIDAFMHLVASLQIRNRATLGGNVVNASPIGDMTILLLALDAEVCLRSPTRERILPLHELYTGYKQLTMQDDEVISSFLIPLDAGDVRIHFEKVSKRTCLDIASVNSAMKLILDGETIRSAVLSVGGVAPIPKRLSGAGDWLEGRAVSTQLVRDLQDRIDEEIAPIDDIRGSAAYKRLLARQLVAAHFIELCPDRISAEVFA